MRESGGEKSWQLSQLPGHYPDKRFPVARIRKRLAAYGWRGERLNKEVARIVAGPDILPERRD
ncbi:hypothetical protein DTC83_25500 [Salmonella enterica]|nr:hypothetical protein [Salmonella enterica]